MNIVQCTQEQSARWDDFILRNGGTYCHRYAWKQVMEQGYGLETFNLVFEDQGRWTAALFVARLPWPRSGKGVSLPYLNYGGSIPCLEDGQVKLLTDWLKKNRFHSLELRYLDPSASGSDVTMIRTLPATESELLTQLSSDERRKLKIARKSGLEVHWGCDHFEGFYNVYANNMGRLGTPVHSRGFIKSILDTFVDQAQLLTVIKNGHVIGGMLMVNEKDTWSDPFVSSLWEYRQLQPARLLYFEAMASAIRHGAQYFDFGRSRKRSGTWEFKRRMKATEYSLRYMTLYNDGKITESGATQVYGSKKAEVVARCWSRLPLKVQNAVGPLLRRYIP